MKFKLRKNKLFINVFWTIIFGLALTMTAISSNYMQVMSDKNSSITTVVKAQEKDIVRSDKIATYIDNIEEGSLVDVIDIKKKRATLSANKRLPDKKPISFRKI